MHLFSYFKCKSIYCNGGCFYLTSIFNLSRYLFCSVSLNYKIVALDFRFGDYI